MAEAYGRVQDESNALRTDVPVLDITQSALLDGNWSDSGASFTHICIGFGALSMTLSTL
jgi:hypothetical protein